MIVDAQLDEGVFAQVMQPKLGGAYDRALVVLRNYNFVDDIGHILMHAVDQGPEKVDEVLGILEAFLKSDASYWHPDFVISSINQKMCFQFIHIYRDVLHLQPNPA